MIWLLLLVSVTLIVYVLPFLPGIYEWRKMTDAKSLDVSSPDRTIIDHQLRLFREYIEKFFSFDLQKYSRENSSHEGVLQNGVEFYITGHEGDIELSSAEMQKRSTKRMVLICKPAILPDDFTFHSRVYAASKLQSGKNNSINNLLVEEDVLLNSNSSINKFIYSGSKIDVGKFCTLNGYAKAKKSIKLLGNNKFQCLYAPRIEVGDSTPDILKTIPNQAEDVISKVTPRKVVHEDFTISEQSNVSSNFVVKGNLYISNNCKIQGNIKCYKNITIGDNANIIGAIISENDIHIGDNCFVQGPIVSSGLITFGKNCVIGIPRVPTSVIGKNIQVNSGSLFSGLLFAKLEGSFAGESSHR